MKTLHLITGPPGSGKLIHAYKHHRDLPIYCCYHLNKKGWRSRDGSTVLLAYSPSRQAKGYWLEEARKEGFEPKLSCVHTPRDVCYARMASRPKNNDLFKEIDDWFKHYTKHDIEQYLTGTELDLEYEKRIYT